MGQAVEREAAVVLAHRDEERGVALALDQGPLHGAEFGQPGRDRLAGLQRAQQGIELPDLALEAVEPGEQARHRRGAGLTVVGGARARPPRGRGLLGIDAGAAVDQRLKLAGVLQHLASRQQQPALAVDDAERQRLARRAEVEQIGQRLAAHAATFLHRAAARPRTGGRALQHAAAFW
ncbi:MAG: hypothetical protein KGL50_10310 [Burkholderiales bacterium]|nr:hypothetical protein [Burkholderiales bacterium]